MEFTILTPELTLNPEEGHFLKRKEMNIEALEKIKPEFLKYAQDMYLKQRIS